VGWLAGGFAGGACPGGGSDESESRTPLARATSKLKTGGTAKGNPAAPTSGMLHVFKLP
jgi:hypothetical protein